MFHLLSIIGILWFARMLKTILFWVYLWQVKEYHFGRFIDHFRTHKGKALIIDKVQILKLVLLAGLLLESDFNYAVLYLLLAVYGAEFLVFAKHAWEKNAKIPKLTAKTAVMIASAMLIAAAYGYGASLMADGILQSASYLAIFDLFTPLVISVIILLFQPLFVLARNQVVANAKKKRAELGNLMAIGITGSYGKTSTKEFLATILSGKFKVVYTKAHQNSEIGISQTILREATEHHQVFVAEMGSYRKGGIALLCGIVKPKIGIVTGVNEQHLALFGSLDNLLSAEGGRELLASLPKDGIIAANGDNKHCLALYRSADIAKRLYAGSKARVDADLWAEAIEVKRDAVAFVAVAKNGEMAHFDVGVLGKHNVQNLLGAILVANNLGMSLEEIANAAKNIQQSQAGITLRQGVHGIEVIDSSYSANPDGVMADLEYLGTFPKKKAIIMPCLIELGRKSSEIHRQIGGKIAKVCDMAIITTKDAYEDIKTGAVLHGLQEQKFLFCDQSRDIFSTITTVCAQGDAVLLEGRVPGEVIKLLSSR